RKRSVFGGLAPPGSRSALAPPIMARLRKRQVLGRDGGGARGLAHPHHGVLAQAPGAWPGRRRRALRSRAPSWRAVFLGGWRPRLALGVFGWLAPPARAPCFWVAGAPRLALRARTPPIMGCLR